MNVNQLLFSCKFTLCSMTAVSLTELWCLYGRLSVLWDHEGKIPKICFKVTNEYDMVIARR